MVTHLSRNEVRHSPSPRPPKTAQSFAVGDGERRVASFTIQPADFSNLAGQLICTTGRAYADQSAQTVTVEVPRERPAVAVRVGFRSSEPVFQLGVKRLRGGSSHLDTYADLSPQHRYRWSSLDAAAVLSTGLVAAVDEVVARVKDWWNDVAVLSTQRPAPSSSQAEPVDGGTCPPPMAPSRRRWAGNDRARSVGAQR